MKILDIREATVSFAAGIRNAGIAYDAMTGSVVVVEAEDRKGQRFTGLGFDSIGRYGHGALLRERFIPRLRAAGSDGLCDSDGLIDPEAAWRVMMANEKPGGHGERAGAVGVLDMALWDMRAKQRAEPAWKTIAAFYGQSGSSNVSLYATGGHYADDPADPGLLIGSLQEARQAGHTRFKIKIGGAPLEIDCQRIEAAIAVTGSGNLAADANGIWEPEMADKWVGGLSKFDLAWIEEPVSPLDYTGLAAVTGRHSVAIGTGENLFSHDDARNLRRHGGLRPDRDWLQFDISLSYGIPEFARIVDLFRNSGWSTRRFAPHAGHVLALHVVAALDLGLAEVAMDTSLPIAALPAHTRVEDGVIRLPEDFGFGIEGNPAFAALFNDIAELKA